MEREALAWIIELAGIANVPIQFCGGLAANCYGSRRELNDIDLFVPAAGFREIVKLGEQAISKPAHVYKEESEGWNLEYVQFTYKGIKVEVGNARGAQIYDATTSSWVLLKIDFSKSVSKSIYGLEVPVMPCDELIAYKQKLSRKVDLEDIRSISSNV